MQYEWWENTAASAAKTANLTQLLDVLQWSLSNAFAGLVESMKTGFAILCKLMQDTKLSEDNEICSESEDLGNEGSGNNDTEELQVK